MGHTKPADLKDLQEVLAQVRAWPGIKEKSPNIFYFKSKPFLHFHDTSRAGAREARPSCERPGAGCARSRKRWADVRDGETWGKPIEVPFDSTAKQRAAFLRETQRRYRVISGPPA